VEGLQLRDAASNSHHLAWGAAFHAGLEAWYEAHRLGVAWTDIPLASGGIITMQEIFRGQYPVQLDPADRVKTQENGTRALALYVRRWAEEDRKWRVLEVEGPGQLVDVTSIGIGELHTDLIVENLEHGGIYVVDHKTTGKQLGPWYWDQYAPNSQITYYIDYAQQKYGSCEGFIINVVSLQWRDEKKSNGANNVEWFDPNDPNLPWLAYSHYEERSYKGGPLGKAGPRMVAWGLTVNFERQVFNRTRQQIEQERRSTQLWISDIETCSLNDEWPFNTGACYSCEYRGGELQGGICRPGYAWPTGREIISLSYRQVCRQVIQVACPTCGGNGIDPESRKSLTVLATDDAQWQALRVYTLPLGVCPRCKGTLTVDGPRCQMDRGHGGACAVEVPEVEQLEIEIEVSCQ